AQKSDAHNRHRLTGTYAGAAEDVHGTAERLAWKGHVRQFRRKPHDAGRVADSELGIASLEQGCDWGAVLQTFHIRAQRIHEAPALVAQATRLGGKAHP